MRRKVRLKLLRPACKKLQSNKGESLGEVLVSALIMAMGILLLATMINASIHMVQKSKVAFKSYYDQQNHLELRDGDANKTNVNLQFSPITTDPGNVNVGTGTTIKNLTAWNVQLRTGREIFTFGVEDTEGGRLP